MPLERRGHGLPLIRSLTDGLDSCLVFVRPGESCVAIFWRTSSSSTCSRRREPIRTTRERLPGALSSRCSTRPSLAAHPATRGLLPRLIIGCETSPCILCKGSLVSAPLYAQAYTVGVSRTRAASSLLTNGQVVIHATIRNVGMSSRKRAVASPLRLRHVSSSEFA